MEGNIERTRNKELKMRIDGKESKERKREANKE
jgi:hypothetical protein